MRLDPLRHATLLLAVASLAACGTMRVNDTNPAVDANPLCVSQPDQPGEPVSSACERKTEATWSSGDSESSGPVDFGGRKP
jgi:hypothetical protein